MSHAAPIQRSDGALPLTWIVDAGGAAGTTMMADKAVACVAGGAAGTTMAADQAVACVAGGAGGTTMAADEAAAHVAVAAIDTVLAMLSFSGACDQRSAPAIARKLRERGAATVCILSVRGESDVLHWLDSDHACGWIAPAAGSEHARGWIAPAADAPAGSPTRLAEVVTDALHRDFVGADALLLGLIGVEGSALPRLSWGAQPLFAAMPKPVAHWKPGVYALVDCAARVGEVLDAGIRTVQLRIKRPTDADNGWNARLRAEAAASAAAARDCDATLVINDHWQLAAELGIPAVHLGQEDVQRLGDAGRAALLASGTELGISSHSVWELCRARSLAPRYIACGPVWPTSTKNMPWLPQGLDNLRWWCGRAGAPVVAIGGILDARHVYEAARAGAAGVCLVRGLADDTRRAAPALLDAFERGRRDCVAESTSGFWPHPTLPPTGDLLPR